jgi:hypothetical protein
VVVDVEVEGEASNSKDMVVMHGTRVVMVVDSPGIKAMAEVSYR